MKKNNNEKEYVSPYNPDVIIIPADVEAARQMRQEQQEIEERRRAIRNERFDLSKQLAEKENRLAEVKSLLNLLSERYQKLKSEISEVNKRLNELDNTL